MATGKPTLACIDIVMVSCNSGAVLEDAVARALDSAECASLSLVDNHSTDGFPERVQRRWSADRRFRFDPVGRNSGFGAACNRGAAVGSAPNLLLLNPDCLIERGSLAALIAVLRADVGIGVLGADVRDACGKDEPAARRRDPTPMRLLADACRPLCPSCQGVKLPRTSDRVQTVDACSGALLLMPRPAWVRVGGFDSDFFLHGEDLDLCRRVRQSGYRVAVANGVPVVHRQGSSSQARPVFVALHKHIGLGRFLLRHQVSGRWRQTLVVLGLAAAFLLRGLPKALLAQRRKSQGG